MRVSPGIRIIAIGLGDENEGSRIPITGPDAEKTFLKYKGAEVWSRLDGDLLRKIVYATKGGKFLSVEPGENFDLGELYQDLIAPAEKRQLESATMMKYDEKFQIFLALGIILIICEALISERKKA
jgi:Ca-activated chloride channel family protein